MQVVIRAETRRLRSTFSFTASAVVHGSVLAWVALGPLIPEARPGLYDQEIRPKETAIVWYDLHQPLPAITPAEKPVDQRPARAHIRSPQNLAAGTRDTAKPPQLIWAPAPELKLAQVLPSPNVLALARPARPVRPFVAPQAERPAPQPAGLLPDAPRIAQTQATAVNLPAPARPQPRAFVPPAQSRTSHPQPALAAAPELTVADRTNIPRDLLPAIQPARRTFIPPVEAAHARVLQTPALPSGPEIALDAPQQAPEVARVAPARAVRPFAAPVTGAPAAAPTQPGSLQDAPAIHASAEREASLAIVSLFPSRENRIPAPKASQKAGFSAGPQPREGGEGRPPEHALVVPGLLADPGAKRRQPTLIAGLLAPTSAENLAAAARSVQVTASDAPTAPGVRIVPPPDARFSDRLVYAVAIQMPNISSYSGSWIVWFAERVVVPGGPTPDLQLPLPLRKVDPKYIPAAAADKVEGTVRLAAIIRRDGRVDSVELLRHLDARLDAAAEEALAKWQFRPALRNGAPVEVDAIFDIPFRLAPKSPEK